MLVGLPAGRVTLAMTVVMAWVAFATAAMAQPVVPPPSSQPGRERERFTEQQGPLSQQGGATISLPSTVAPKGAEHIMLHVQGVHITGATVYTPQQLAPLYADLVGQEVTLAAVYALAQKITTKYGNDGYVISRAIVPPQQLNPGGATVEIQVIEGYVDRVEWPHELDKFRDFFSYYTARITAERPSNIHTIERYLLFAGDLPGLKFKNSLKPSSANQGAATLVVEIISFSPVDWNARVDNRGPPSQGPLEFLTSLTANNLLHMHDALTVSYAGPFKTEELKYIYGQYSQVLTAEGLVFFADASDGWGRPNEPSDFQLVAPDYRTQSIVYETGLTYPIIRSREHNLSFTTLVFASDNQGFTPVSPDGPPSSLDKLRGARLKVNADWADPFNGINQVNVVGSKGTDGFGSTQNGQMLASRVNGRVDFSKLETTITRVQQLPANFSALLSAYGQLAGTPLLNPELCGYGGRVFGRAFDPSQIVADECVETLGELRFDVPTPASMAKQLTQVQLYGFYDHGWLHNLAPDVGTPRNFNAASAGGGLRIGWLDMFTADLSADKAVEGPRNDWRFFFILSAKSK
jgi:hemolysin activation/secretion protein